MPDEKVEDLVAALAEHDLQVRPSAFRRGTMACTGLEFCKLAIVETKQHAQDLYAELEKRLPDFDVPIGINVNGCPNSCARFQTADIGFKGSMVRDANGEMVEGFQVHLGGHLGVEAAFGRKFRGHKVTKAETADYCERVLRGLPRAPDPGRVVRRTTSPAPRRSGCCDARTRGAGRARQLPVFHCPYCGDEELTPYGESATAGAARPACGPSRSA